MSGQADYHVLVIGGGIHGVGVAQAAAAAGYRVALLEQQHLAYGTSRWSSKLIHGGLRYLESFEFGLVRESLYERELLIKLAPDLVKRQDFLIPVYHNTSRRPWLIRAGLLAYTVLAGGRKETWFKSLPQDQWQQLDGLQTQGLQKVFQYTDAQTDDAKLTQAVMHSAIELGAELICPAKFIGGEIKEDSVHVTYEQNGQPHTLTARTVVNAAGPWARELLSRFSPNLPDFPVDNIQGTHIELPGSIKHGCYYLEANDRRAVFVMPWQGRTLLGTTEHHYQGDPHRVHSRDQAVDYLLDVYRRHFPDRDDQVLGRWAGLRVLPAASGSAFKRSRETQLPVDNRDHPRVLSIFGGKLTGYRATAEKVVRLLQSSLPEVPQKARTDELPLTLDAVVDVDRDN